MQNCVVIKYLRITLLFCFVFLCDIAIGQRRNGPTSTEVAKCTEYKKSVFETKRPFAGLIYDAPVFEVVEDNCKAYAPFIVGGLPANPKEFPHMARLGVEKQDRNTRWLCGGTLISEKYVLTAAHCFFAPAGEINIVRLGELDFSTSNDDAQPEDFSVKRYIEHPDYDDEGIRNDIGLIELDRSVVFNAYKHPACLPVNTGEEFDKYIAVGWGNTKVAGLNSNQLYKVRLDRFPFSQCQRTVEFYGAPKLRSGLNSISQVCAGSEAAKDTCYGDSGGPLLAYHDNYACMYYLVGVTSTGIGGCGTPNVPAIYTRVHKYLDWIKKTVW